MLRNILSLLAIVTLLISCGPGPVGPQGPPGLDGLDGLNGKDGEEAYTFEFQTTFSSPEFSTIFEFPSDFTVLDSDVILVYALWGSENDLDIWRLLPQTVLTDDGTLIYNSDFTTSDVSVFLESDFDLNILGPNFTDDWIMRVVVIPAQFQNGRVANDYSNFYQVLENHGIE